MKIIIKTFASVYDICGFSDKEMEVSPGCTVADVINMLVKQFHDMQDVVDELLFAVNEEYCTGTRKLIDNDVLAVFPPVSGG
jgi:MoaD family protein